VRSSNSSQGRKGGETGWSQQWGHAKNAHAEILTGQRGAGGTSLAQLSEVMTPAPHSGRICPQAVTPCLCVCAGRGNAWVQHLGLQGNCR
jgi:hypothetical protein